MFVAKWDGEKWTGDLTVPGVELAGPQSASGVKPLLRLMRLLDDDFRAMAGQPMAGKSWAALERAKSLLPDRRPCEGQHPPYSGMCDWCRPPDPEPEPSID